MGRLFWRLGANTSALPALAHLKTQSGIICDPFDRYVYGFLHHQSFFTRVNTETGKVETIPAGTPVRSLSISPDGKLLYVGSAVGGLNIFSVDSEHPAIVDRYPLNGFVSDIACTPDGSTLFLAMGREGVKRIDLRSKRVSTVIDHPYPMFAALDPPGKTLYISYQGPGVGGRPGHDTVEWFDVKTGRLTGHFGGPPLVGGKPSVSPATGLLWVDGWDACNNPKYDHEGCPAFPVSIYQVIRPADGVKVFTWASPEHHDGEAVFLGDGSRVMIGGRSVSVVDGSKFKLLENWTGVFGHVASPANHPSAYIMRDDTGELMRLEPEPADCAVLPPGTVNLFTLDGTWEDQLDHNFLQPSGAIRFTAGRVGQAVRVGPGASVKLQSVSDYGFGEDQGTIAFWLKTANGPHRIIRRLKENRGWSFDWTGLKLTFRILGAQREEVELTAPFTQGQWHQVVATREASEVSLFLDGQRIDSANHTMFSKSDFTDPIMIGENAERTAPEFDMDELTIFSRVLTNDEIGKMYSLRTAGKCKP